MGMGTRLQLGHGKEWKRMWMGMRMTPIPMGKKFPDFFYCCRLTLPRLQTNPTGLYTGIQVDGSISTFAAIPP